MSADPTFADTFRHLAAPRIRQRILVNGTFVALGLMDFTDADADVMALARRLGALHLPERAYHALLDAVLTSLAARVDSLMDIAAKEGAAAEAWASKQHRAWAVAARALARAGHSAP